MTSPGGSGSSPAPDSSPTLKQKLRAQSRFIELQTTCGPGSGGADVEAAGGGSIQDAEPGLSHSDRLEISCSHSASCGRKGGPG